MDMFTKLSKNIPISRFETQTLWTRYGRPDDTGTFRGIQYHIAKGDFDGLYNVIPLRYRSDFAVLCMSINRSRIPPHTDSGILATINCYVETSGCVTRFWQLKKDQEPVTSKIANQTNGAIFDEACLESAAEFTAADGESWLLDVTKPHSVESSSDVPVARRALVLQTRTHSYNAVYDMLKETGYV